MVQICSTTRLKNFNLISLKGRARLGWLLPRWKAIKLKVDISRENLVQLRSVAFFTNPVSNAYLGWGPPGRVLGGLPFF